MAAAPRPTAADWVAAGDYLDTPAGRVFYRVEGRGPALVLLHGFPTWSYDWAAVAPALADAFRVVTLDFPGYGFSQKRGDVDFRIAAGADVVERVLRRLGIGRATLAIHDVGATVGQELLDRDRRGALGFRIDTLHVLNAGIVYAAYRPARIQRWLARPVIGRLVASRITRDTVFAGLNRVRGASKLDEAEFAELWAGMSHEDGHRLAYRQIGYNAERDVHHRRWEAALFGYAGPVQLIWGLADPVSGRHVLDAARPRLPHARMVELPEAGHFPQAEAPERVAAALRQATR